MLESRHEDNPVLFDDDGTTTEAGASYIAKLDNLTGPRYHRLRRGLWVAAEGIIFEQWDPAVHLVEKFWPPKEWPRFWVVDFGYTNPFVLQWWAQDPDGRLFLYRELYQTKCLVEDHAAAALEAVKSSKTGEWREPKPRAIICDHDAEDRATLERHLGMSTVAATKNVSEGLQAVQSRMRPAGDGKPRLFVMRDAVTHRDSELVEAKKPACTAEEIPGYVWAPSMDGKPVKDQPLKLDDHGCDAMRYLVAECALGARPRVRFV
jgi:phage terminase large subunit